MTAAVIRLLPFVTAGGAWQMAADEVMLEAAAAGSAAFRVYGWSTATLSLGYFQPASHRAEPILATLPYVRRASGGAALVHDQEATYALALPAGVPWQTRGEPWLRRMHCLLRDVFASFGVTTRLCEREQKRGDVLCFLHHTPDDLLLGMAKVAGSAQRKMRGALLQHGGILLAQSRYTLALPGIAELTGVVLSADAFRASLAEHLARQTGWRVEPGDWTADERARIESRAAAKYADPAWNDKR